MTVLLTDAEIKEAQQYACEYLIDWSSDTCHESRVVAKAQAKKLWDYLKEKYGCMSAA
jgi:hypothetical protein